MSNKSESKIIRLDNEIVKPESKIIRLNLNEVAKEAETHEDFVEGINKELSKLEKLAGPNWRDAFKEHGE